MEAKLIKSAIMRINSRLRPFPTLFYYPGIRSSSFWKANDFSTAKLLEEKFNIIQSEFLEVSKSHKLSSDYQMIDKEKSLHKGNWDWFSYISKGEIQHNFEHVFPKTFSILEQVEDKMTGTPFSYCFFSRLDPKSSISAHYGPCNIRLRLHLGLDIPSDCHIIVGDVQRTWKNGKCIVFDDTYIHEVANNNENNSRTILLLDIWHPDLTQDEIIAIKDMFSLARNKGWINKDK